MVSCYHQIIQFMRILRWYCHNISINAYQSLPQYHTITNYTELPLSRKKQRNKTVILWPKLLAMFKNHVMFFSTRSYHILPYGGFLKWGYPQKMVGFKGQSHQKWMGYPGPVGNLHIISRPPMKALKISKSQGWLAGRPRPTSHCIGNPKMKPWKMGMFTTEYGFKLNIAEQIPNEVELC